MVNRKRGLRLAQPLTAVRGRVVAYARPAGVAWAPVCAALILVICGCRETSTPQRQAARATTPHGEQRTPSAGVRSSPVSLPAPGSGVVVGRLVDAATGLAVPDGGVSLLGLGRRTVSGVDGSFRFDGAPSGSLTLVFAPVDGYVPRSLTLRVPEEGVDIGLVSLRPGEAPTLIVPDVGGTVAGCGDSRLALQPGSLAEPLAIGMTCLESAETLPVEPPPGRLPLAAVHIEPADAALGQPAELAIGLPSQPRFTPGVSLDLLRLDLERLLWLPVGSLAVHAEGRRASGTLTSLGTYLVVAPPFGARTDDGGQPSILRLSLAASPESAAGDTFEAGIPVVYLSLDYANMANTKVLVRTADRRGQLLFESERPYTDSGRDHVPMTTATGRWSAGEYCTSVYLGDPPAAVDSITWRVTPAVGAATSQPVATRVGQPAAAGPKSGGRPPTEQPCRPRYDWYAYAVRPGDTLYSLALRTGSTVESLMRGNCLSGVTIYAGTTLYLPRPPARTPVALATTTRVPGRSATPWPTPWLPWPTATPVWPPTPGWPSWPTLTPVPTWPPWPPAPTPGSWPTVAAPPPPIPTAELPATAVPPTAPPEPTLAPPTEP